VPTRLDVDKNALTSFCRKWRVAQIAVFGSALRSDFGPSSDVDLLVTPETGVIWSLFEEVDMREELSRLMSRPVDLVIRGAVERSRNWIRREEILSTAEPLHVSG
jgi:predicted nucleotidyltransferase